VIDDRRLKAWVRCVHRMLMIYSYSQYALIAASTHVIINNHTAIPFRSVHMLSDSRIRRYLRFVERTPSHDTHIRADRTGHSGIIHDDDDDDSSSNNSDRALFYSVSRFGSRTNPITTITRSLLYLLTWNQSHITHKEKRMLSSTLARTTRQAVVQTQR